VTAPTLTLIEMQRIKYELGDTVLNVGAQPWIGIRSVWNVIKDNVLGSDTAPTYSSTAITSAGAVTITVASAVDLVAGTRVQIDVDGQRETCTIRNVSGSVLSLIARKTHSGTYPVEIESSLTIVRGIISDLTALEQVNTLASFDALGLRRVDEVEWAEKGAAYYVEFGKGLLRRKLASACGVSWIYNAARGSGALEVY
jgi:hypothetical protein